MHSRYLDASERSRSSDPVRTEESRDSGRMASETESGRASGLQRDHGNQAVAQAVGGKHRQTDGSGKDADGADEETSPAEPEVDAGAESRTATRPCPPGVKQAITRHQGNAESWRKAAHREVDTLLSLAERRMRRASQSGAAAGRGRRFVLGSRLTAGLADLNPHFAIADAVVTNVNAAESSPTVSWPLDPGVQLSAAGYRGLRNTAALVTIRNRFRDVSTADSFTCGVDCPETAEGADVLGEAAAGSGTFTIFSKCWSKQSARAKTAAVLHEEFHASFGGFDHDSYSHKSGYPGSAPRSNADSYTTYASIVKTGKSYRIREISIGPDGTITGGGSGATEKNGT